MRQLLPQFQQAMLQDPRQAYAHGLMQQGSSTAPVQSWGEAVARALQAPIGGFFAAQNRRDYEGQDAQYRAGLAKALGSPDVLAGLQDSGDPNLQGMALQAKLARALKDPTETFTPLTDAEEEKYGLDTSGTYQRGNLSGKIDTLTAPQPKRKTGETRDYLSGGQKITEQWDGEKWAPLGSGPAYAPPDPKTSWHTVTDASGKPLYQESNLGERKALPGQEGGGEFKQANTLRDEYNTITKDFRTVQDAYNKIQSTSNTGAGDMSLLYSYVKLLDPGSVVRESEFATAAASGSFGEQIQGAVSRIMSGERLPDSLRNAFKSEATRIYQGQKVSFDNAGKAYSEIAKRNGINPDDVIVPYATALPTQPPVHSAPPASGKVLKFDSQGNPIP